MKNIQPTITPITLSRHESALCQGVHMQNRAPEARKHDKNHHPAEIWNNCCSASLFAARSTANTCKGRQNAFSQRTPTTQRGRIPSGVTWQRVNPTDPPLLQPPPHCRQCGRLPRSSVSTLIHLPPFIISTPANGNAIAVRDQICRKVASDDLYQQGDLGDASAPIWVPSFAVPRTEISCIVHVNGKRKAVWGSGSAQVHTRPQKEK